jgi:hypothetical protein
MERQNRRTRQEIDKGAKGTDLTVMLPAMSSLSSLVSISFICTYLCVSRSFIESLPAARRHEAPRRASPRVPSLAHWASRLPKASKGVRDVQGRALEALAGHLEAKPADLRMMSEYRPRAACGDPTREVASPQAPTDGLGNYTSS